MAKVYSDEEIEKLSNNPCVNYVCRNRLSLTLEFKQQMYDIWVQKHNEMKVKAAELAKKRYGTLGV